MEKITSRSVQKTRAIAGSILRGSLKETREPVILALRGELGSGKTTFVQGLARELGLDEKIQSPTFILMKLYQLPRRVKNFKHFIHIDAYRLQNISETRHLNLKSLLQDRDAVVVIEWAERIKKLVPKEALWIHFKHGKRTCERVIQVRAAIQNGKVEIQSDPEQITPQFSGAGR